MLVFYFKYVANLLWNLVFFGALMLCKNVGGRFYFSSGVEWNFMLLFV